MGREHRIPLKQIRCMTMKRYQELKKLWAWGTPAGDILYPNCPAKRLELKKTPA